MMKKCVFALLLASSCLAVYGQKSSSHSRSSSRHDHSNDRYEHRDNHRKSDCDDDDDDDDRERDRNYSRDRDRDYDKRRFTIVIPGRRGDWELQRRDHDDDKDKWSRREEREPRRYRKSEPVPVFTFGPKVGVNYATFLKNPVSLDADYNWGYHIGGFMRFNLRRAYIQPEFLYSTKGGTLDLSQSIGGPYDPGLYQVNSQYLDVPLLLGARLVSTRNFNLRIFAGPMASFTIGGQGLENFLNENEKTGDYLEDILMGYHAGVGVDLGAITLDTRYEWTMMGAANLQRANLGKPRSALIQASVGIKMF